jgi:putative salt-induced outer membrane protein YdiY
VHRNHIARDSKYAFPSTYNKETEVKRAICLAAILFLAGGSSRPLHSQEQPAAKEPWTASVGLGLTTTNGNSDITNLSLTFESVREVPKQKWSTGANLAYARTEGDETANKGALTTQFDYIPGERLFYFGKLGLEFDKFANLDLRTSPGVGVGYALVKNEKTTLTASVGANVVTDFFDDGSEDTRGMLSFAEGWAYAVSPTATISQTFNIQNNFEDFGDYLIGAEVSLTAKIAGPLSLKASLIDKYDSTPFSEDLENNDVTFITSLTYTL